ncbi:hypothetical protein TWF694_006400 [Orbilia ellipsospora]|uniref:F-box domain-containing protein n=1 Tax=Orbilia ellipsospora TaxID=2528407 RepID=A0AAV9XK37_9PEZI
MESWYGLLAAFYPFELPKDYETIVNSSRFNESTTSSSLATLLSSFDSHNNPILVDRHEILSLTSRDSPRDLEICTISSLRNSVRLAPISFGVIIILTNVKLPHQDLRNLALSCWTVRDFVAPILYRVLRLHYDASPEAQGLRNDEIDAVFQISASTFQNFKRFNIKTTDDFLGLRDDNTDAKSQHSPARKAIALVDKILNKFGDGQLESLRFETETSVATLAHILRTQYNLRDLHIGDFYEQKYTPFKQQFRIPPLLSAKHEIQLESLAFAEIQPQMLSTMRGVLRQTSRSLKRLQIGHPEYRNDPDLDHWASWRTRWPHQLPIEEILREGRDETLKLGEVFGLPALEQLYVLNDTESTRLLEFLIFVTDNGEPYAKLTRLRLSACYYDTILVEKVTSKAPNIQSLQISVCNFPLATVESILPSTKPLHTLQISRCFDADLTDWLPVNFHRQSLRRLWLECTYNCDPNLCPSMSKFWDATINPYPLSSENWPVLEELAIGYPGWERIPTINSLKVLRILLDRQEIADQDGNETDNEIQAEECFRECIKDYAEKLCQQFNNNEEPPQLRIVVLERANDTCIRSNAHLPCYFVINYKRDEKLKTWAPKIVTNPRSVVSQVALMIGSSSYLLGSGPPAPERFWEDNWDAYNNGKSELDAA